MRSLKSFLAGLLLPTLFRFMRARLIALEEDAESEEELALVEQYKERLRVLTKPRIIK